METLQLSQSFNWSDPWSWTNCCQKKVELSLRWPVAIWSLRSLRWNWLSLFQRSLESGFHMIATITERFYFFSYRSGHCDRLWDDYRMKLTETLGSVAGKVARIVFIRWIAVSYANAVRKWTVKLVKPFLSKTQFCGQSKFLSCHDKGGFVTYRFIESYTSKGIKCSMLQIKAFYFL